VPEVARGGGKGALAAIAEEGETVSGGGFMGEARAVDAGEGGVHGGTRVDEHT